VISDIQQWGDMSDGKLFGVPHVLGRKGPCRGRGVAKRQRRRTPPRGVTNNTGKHLVELDGVGTGLVVRQEGALTLSLGRMDRRDVLQ
jgi:hypothetical protein